MSLSGDHAALIISLRSRVYWFPAGCGHKTVSYSGIIVHRRYYFGQFCDVRKAVGLAAHFLGPWDWLRERVQFACPKRRTRSDPAMYLRSRTSST